MTYSTRGKEVGAWLGKYLDGWYRVVVIDIDIIPFVRYNIYGIEAYNV